MTREPLVVEAEPDGALDTLLDEADDRPVLIQRAGRRYRLDRVDTISTEEAERSIAGILAAAGTWKDMDAEAFKANVAERRRSSSRLPVAP